MFFKKPVLSILFLSILFTGCIEKEPPKFEIGKDYQSSEQEEYTFYELKPKTDTEMLVKQNISNLKQLDPIKDHKEYNETLAKSISLKHTGIVSFESDSANKLYRVTLKAEAGNSVDGYIGNLAKRAKSIAGTISKIADTKSFNALEVIYKFHDSSEINTKFSLKQLNEIKSEETYLIFDSVLETKKAEGDNLANTAVEKACNNILSVELNPFFCGVLKKSIISKNDIIENSINSDNKEPKKPTDAQNVLNEMQAEIEEEKKQAKKSSLSSEEVQVLKDAGFDVDLN